MTTKPKAKKITILPREPLTDKAYKAIEAYALARCKGLRAYPLLIKYTLEAERMRRTSLYEWLENHGYKWKLRHWYEPDPEKGKKPGAENEP